MRITAIRELCYTILNYFLEMCPADRFLCDNKASCIPGSWQCDDIYDCDDGTDEAGCTCEPDEYRCENRRCISQRKVCDEVDNCGDGSDENDCSEYDEKVLKCPVGRALATMVSRTQRTV